jgi:hypothetical protein
LRSSHIFFPESIIDSNSLEEFPMHPANFPRRDFFRAGTVVVVLLALAACGKKPEDNAMPREAFVSAGVQMKLEPPAAPNCKPDTLYRATLIWSVEGKDTPKTEVRIDRPDGAVFARSNDRTARAETGNWVKPGTWFLLFDRNSGDLIGSLRAGPVPCP